MLIKGSHELNIQSKDFLDIERWKRLTRNTLKSRRAISPILATLLLIVIAVAAIVVTYAWIMMYMNSTRQQAGVMLSVENTRFYGAPTDTSRNRVDFTVKNTLTSDTQIVRIYIGNATRSLVEVTSSSDIGSGKPLAGGGAPTTITVTWPNTLANSWEPQKIYYYKIVPAQGTDTGEISVQAPV